VLRGLSQTALTSQSLRYVMVGGSMSLLFATLVWAFHSAGLYGWLSSLLASVCVSIPTVFLHRYFTFGVEGSFISQAMGTLAIAASNVPMGVLTIFLLVDVLEWNAFLSGLIATVIVALFNYTIFSRIVFKKPAIK
jgi:putative flippase GtrA